MTAHVTHISFPIRGMTCASCVNHVQRALASIQGVSEVSWVLSFFLTLSSLCSTSLIPP